MTATTVDWLTFRSRARPQQITDALHAALGGEHPLLLTNPRPGHNGYAHSLTLDLGGMTVGNLETGGDHQRGWTTVSVTGKGCAWVPDWRVAQDALEGVDYVQRRVDLAHDTYRAEVTHARVRKAYDDGMFTTRGRTPDLDPREPLPRSKGWTVYVGKRESAKYFRGYEKGLEQANKYSPDGHLPDTIEGIPVRDWYRCELELKAKEGPLPLDLIDRRDEYFAGAYPFCRSLIEVEPFQLSMPRARRPQNDLRAALAGIRHQYGPTLFTALVAYMGDIGAVWDQVVGNKHSQPLIESGVLLVNHDQVEQPGPLNYVNH